jgi:hypothetical protein
MGAVGRLAAECLWFTTAIALKESSMTKTKTFNHPIKVATILKYALFSAYQRPQWAKQIPNDTLIKEWWYSRLANAYVRYWSIKPRCSTNERITLNHFGGEDYRQALQKLLEQRGIFDEADNSYLIDFVALEKAIAS